MFAHNPVVYLQHGPHMLWVACAVPQVAAGCCPHHLPLCKLLQVAPAIHRHTSAQQQLLLLQFNGQIVKQQHSEQPWTKKIKCTNSTSRRVEALTNPHMTTAASNSCPLQQTLPRPQTLCMQGTTSAAPPVSMPYRCACAESLPAPALLLLLPPASALKGCSTVVQPMAAARRLRLVVRDVCKVKKTPHRGVVWDWVWTSALRFDVQ
jgi:hypothetical protein